MGKALLVAVIVIICCFMATMLLPTASADCEYGKEVLLSGFPPCDDLTIPSISSLVQTNANPQNQVITLSNDQKVPYGEWFTLPDGEVIPVGEMYNMLGPHLYQNLNTFIEDDKVVTDARVISSLIQDQYVYPPTNPPPGIVLYQDKRPGTSDAVLWVKLWFHPNPPPTRKIFSFATISSDADPVGTMVILEETSPGSKALTSVSSIRFSLAPNSTSSAVFHTVLQVNQDDHIRIVIPYGGRNTVTVVPFHINSVDPNLSGAVKTGAGNGSSGVSFPPSLLGPNEVPVGNCAAFGGLDPSGDSICAMWKPGGVPLQVTYNGATYYGPACGAIGQDACPSTYTKDLYVMVDSLSGNNGGYGITSSAISDLKTAFKGGAFVNTQLHGRPGTVYPKVQLHIQTFGDSLNADSQCVNGINFPGSTGTCDFQQIKQNDFLLPDGSSDSGTFYEKAAVFHFALFGNLVAGDTGSSGVGEEYGNDAMVTLGASGFSPTTVDQQQTLMHELGHNLGLYHGGDANTPNCKPNYLSVMNYLYQLPILDPNWFLDYSQNQFGGNGQTYIDETTTTTSLGASQPSGMTVIYGSPSASPYYGQTTAGSSGLSISGDSNYLSQSNSLLCGSDDNPPIQLNGFQDWGSSVLKYDFYNGPNYGVDNQTVKGMFELRLKTIGGLLHAEGLSPPPNMYLKDAEKQSNDFNYVGAVSDLYNLENNVQPPTLSATAYGKTTNLIDSVINSYKLVGGLVDVSFGTVYGKINSGVTLTVKDPYNTDNSVAVNVTSDTDPHGTSVTMNRINSTSFQGQIVLSTSNTGPDQIQVSIGDTVYVAYGKVFFTTIQVTTDHNPPSSPGITISTGGGVTLSPADFGYTSWPFPPLTSTIAKFPSYGNFVSSTYSGTLSTTVITNATSVTTSTVHVTPSVTTTTTTKIIPSTTITTTPSTPVSTSTTTTPTLSIIPMPVSGQIKTP